MLLEKICDFNLGTVCRTKQHAVKWLSVQFRELHQDFYHMFPFFMSFLVNISFTYCRIKTSLFSLPGK